MSSFFLPSEFTRRYSLFGRPQEVEIAREFISISTPAAAWRSNRFRELLIVGAKRIATRSTPQLQVEEAR